MEVNGGCCKYLEFVFSKNHFNKIIVNYKILHSPPLGDILLHTERLSRAAFVAAKRVNPLTTFLCEATSHCYNRLFCFAGAIAGVLRIASYSSVLRSVIIPSLAPLLREHPKIQTQLICKTMKELPLILYRSEADIIIMDYKIERHDLETIILGHEKYVVIESKKHTTPKDVYLDNNSEDMATENFFKAQRSFPKYKRAYMSDCYGIIDAVINGIGKAVMPKHLIAPAMPIKVISGFKPYTLNVTLHYMKQPFYSKLHQEIVGVLKNRCSLFLKD